MFPRLIFLPFELVTSAKTVFMNINLNFEETFCSTMFRPTISEDWSKKVLACKNIWGWLFFIWIPLSTCQYAGILGPYPKPSEVTGGTHLIWYFLVPSLKYFSHSVSSRNNTMWFWKPITQPKQWIVKVNNLWTAFMLKTVCPNKLSNRADQNSFIATLLDVKWLFHCNKHFHFSLTFSVKIIMFWLKKTLQLSVKKIFFSSFQFKKG